MITFISISIFIFVILVVLRLLNINIDITDKYIIIWYSFLNSTKRKYIKIK